jgi:HAD superfamily hydrolase (TIGR01509 family)
MNNHEYKEFKSHEIKVHDNKFRNIKIHNIKGAIFDLDGTLIDSMPYWDNLGIEYLRQKGCNIPKNTSEILNTLKTMSLAQSARYFKEHYSVPGREEEIIKEIVGLIESHYRLDIPLKPSVVPFLDMLCRNNVKMCIATATDRDLAKAALERLNVLKYFEFILTCTEAGAGKDDPEFFLKALKMLKTPREGTIVFEDALHAIKSAKAAGLLVAAVYDRSAHDEREEIKFTADVYLDSFEDWKVLI